ncbi:MAG: hypothetical protein LiPW30_751 [Parcubacteria group bacterium LiPW_30]|nr:MAG: hypothetical protein LiPW30_751 [Parcubacteria group bacterium LiPW_30]
MQFNKSAIIIISVVIILTAVLLGIVVLLGPPTSQSNTPITQNQEKARSDLAITNSETFLAKDITKIIDQDIIAALSTNPDAKDYMQKNSDFKITGKAILTKDSILAGQTAENFKEVYQGLDLEDERYLKVDLMNTAGDNGLVAVLDFKESKVLKAYGLILLRAGVGGE